MATGFTIASLADLERAIATGARAIKYQDREYEARTLKDQLSIRRMMRRELGVAPKKKRRIPSSYNKGLS